MLNIFQVGLNTSDLAGSLRLFSEGFGFQNAGGQWIWGEIMKIQGLTPQDRGLMWWMVGAQDFFQLEFFHHSKPKQSPMRADWRPCDCGWVRIGIGINDLDSCLRILNSFDITILGQSSHTEERRLAFRDPFVGMIVEVIERADYADGPHIVYATSSVSNLESARKFYEKTLDLPTIPLETLHNESDESLWGLAGAKRDGFVVKVADTYLEIVQYLDPEGKIRDENYSISDQGIVNVGIGCEHNEEIENVYHRLQHAGITPPLKLSFDGVTAFYVTEPERELEFASIRKDKRGQFGFESISDFITL